MSNTTTTKTTSKATAAKEPNAKLDAVAQSAAGKNQDKIFDSEAHKRNLQNAQEALLNEFQTLMAGNQSEELRESIEHNLNRAREILQERHQQWSEQSSELKERAEAYVQEKPWQSLGIAAGAGLLLGLILRR